MKRLTFVILATLALTACQDPAAPTDPATEPAHPSGSLGQVSRALAGQWATMAPMLTARHALALGVANSRLYAIGGQTSGDQTLASAEIYNAATNSWASIAPMPEPRSRGNGARFINGLLYVAGGWDASHRRTNTLFAYDVATNTWSRKKSLPIGSGCGGSATIRNMLYVFSGCASEWNGVNAPWGQLHRYDPSTNSWTKLASAPVQHVYPALGQIDGKIYVAGGHHGGWPTATLHVYDPATNMWTAKAPMPGFRFFTSGFALAGKLYVVGGGAPPNGARSATMLIYDPTTDSWSNGQPMSTARDALSLHGMGGLLYAVGGRVGSSLSLVERYTP
jgi:hypothetical protein